MSLNDKYIVPSSPGFNSIFSDPDLRLYEGNFLYLVSIIRSQIPGWAFLLKKEITSLLFIEIFLKEKLKVTLVST